MANSNTYINGFTSDSTQMTTLSNIQGNGLKLPTPTSEFIDIRSPGKIERIFSTPGNANVLYTTNKPQDSYLKGPLASPYVFRSIERGQSNKINSIAESSRRDGDRVTRFLRSSAGTKFILKQLVLQGFQPHDETKVYNPASPIIASLRLATFGLVDRPTRHLDTSNIVGGLLGGTGLGSAVRTVGGLFGGGGPPVPSPPRSSVASEASRGLGLSTFTSFLGGGDRSDKVVSPLARPDVRDLLRGKTATDAYSSPRYSKLVGGGGGKFFSRLLSSAGRFIQNNTIVGGIVPPKQPWAANYRADEKTYDLYLNAGKLFDPNHTGIGGGGILSGILNTIGFGKKANYSQAVNQRFYNKSENSSDFNRRLTYIVKNNRVGSSTNEIGVATFDKSSGKTIITSNKITNTNKDSARYTDTIKVDVDGTESGDQLLNYDTLVKNPKLYNGTFTDKQSDQVKNITQTFVDSLNNITGGDPSGKYKIDNTSDLTPLQFSKPNKIGFNYLNEVKSSKNSKRDPVNDLTYEGRFNTNTEINNTTRTKRKIIPTNDVDYLNSLTVLSENEFTTNYSNKQGFDKYGVDLIKFYFYDIINRRYIPFSATVKSITDTNTAEWEPIEYLGRPDKQFYYKGFTREVSFNFTVNAHSVKELMPMWQRINYLVGLTRPSNYTDQSKGGFMIPPMVQLTMGDFYKNHFVVIRTCNISIPDDAAWETIPENVRNDWYYGPNKAITWQNSIGKFGQFPRTVDINMNMNILEKDRPYTGKAVWGDAPTKINNNIDTFENDDTFSAAIRYDNIKSLV